MKLGVNRIAYQPKDLQTGKHVMVRIYNPNAEIFDKELVDMGNSLYMKDLNFKYAGPYIYHVYEDGQYKGRKIFRVEKSSTVIPYNDELEGV